MGVIIGPTPWWQNNLIRACPVKTILPDGSAIICKNGGTAWIVAPYCTEVNTTWNNFALSGYTTVGNKPCICDWPVLNTRLINCGFNPSDWFVPSLTELQMGYNCRSNWDTYSLACYWSSTEGNSPTAFYICFLNSCQGGAGKSCPFCVRAFRKVTY